MTGAIASRIESLGDSDERHRRAIAPRLLAGPRDLLLRRRQARLVNVRLREAFSGVISVCRLEIYGDCSIFTEFGKGFLNPSLYAARWGRGTKMSGFTFQPQKSQTQEATWNPRAAGVAGADPGGAADAGTRPLARRHPHQADRARLPRSSPTSPSIAPKRQREVISSVETVLKSAAYIRASAGGFGRSCDILRASLPVNLPWIRSLMIVGSDGRVQCSTKNAGRPRPQRPRLSQEGAGDPRLRRSAISCSQIANDEPIVMAAYPVSAVARESDAVIVAGINLDWMSKIMNNLSGRPRHFGGAGRQHRNGAGGAGGSGQHDRPYARRRSAAGRRVADKAINSDQETGLFSFVAADGVEAHASVSSRIPGTAVAADRQHRRSQGGRRRSTATSAPPICSSAWSACSCCSAR